MANETPEERRARLEAENKALRALMADETLEERWARLEAENKTLTLEVQLARLEAENLALREQMERQKTARLRMKVSEKGGLSVYGLGRFPVTLYKDQWTKLLGAEDEIKSFLKENDELLKGKQ